MYFSLQTLRLFFFPTHLHSNNIRIYVVEDGVLPSVSTDSFSFQIPTKDDIPGEDLALIVGIGGLGIQLFQTLMRLSGLRFRSSQPKRITRPRVLKEFSYQSSHNFVIT